MGPRHRSRGPVLPAKVWPPNRKYLPWAGVPPTTSPRPRPPFVLGEYADGVVVEVPLECPWRDAEAPCDVVLHTLRVRKAGPGHPLAVCRCHAHGASFSVYPPGFVPYARRALLDTPGPPAPAVSFAAVATEAATGTAWDRVAEHGSARWWSTQWRLLRRFRHALGAFEAGLHEMVALALGLPLHLLSAVKGAVGYRARGRALMSVLEALDQDLDRLLLAGALAGCWGSPWRWQRAPPRLVPLVPAHLDRAKASTTLEHGFADHFG